MSLALLRADPGGEGPGRAEGGERLGQLMTVVQGRAEEGLDQQG